MKATPKYLTGGMFDSLFTIYTPSEVSRPRASERSSSSTKEEKKDKDEITTKDLLELLKGLDALPSDTLALTQTIKLFFSNLSLFGGNNLTNLSTAYINSISKLQLAKYHKELFNETKKLSIANNSLQDIAFTNSGQLVTVNKKTKKFAYFTPEEWASVKNSGDYIPLTNSNLLYYRLNNPAYAFNDGLLPIVENGIGLDKVMELIKNSLFTLGKSEVEQSGYYTKLAKQGAKVLEELANDPDGVYKIESFNSNQNTQIKAALSYVYLMLPKNAQLRLLFASNNKNIMKGVQDLMLNMLISESTDVSKKIIDFDSTATKTAGLSNDPADKTKYNQAALMTSGNGYETKLSLITKGEENKLDLDAIGFNLHSPNNESYGDMTLTLLKKVQQASNLDFRNVSIGDQMVNMDMSNYVKTDGQVKLLDLPIDQVALDKEGVIKPDLNATARYDSVKKQIKEQGIEDVDLINALLAKEKLPIQYNKDGSINYSNYARFAVFKAKAISTVLLDPDLLPFSDRWFKIEEDNKKQELFLETLASLNNTKVKDDDVLKNYDYNDKWSFIEGNYQSTFEANMYIPYNDSMLNAMANEGLTSSEIQSMAARDKKEKIMNRAGGF